MIDRREADAGADGGLGGRGEGVSSRDGGCNLGLQLGREGSVEAAALDFSRDILSGIGGEVDGVGGGKLPAAAGVRRAATCDGTVSFPCGVGMEKLF